MRATHSRDRSKPSYSLGVQLKSVESFKLHGVGVTINYDLSWGKHVSNIVNKENKVLGVIKRSLGNDNRHAFSCPFKSLVRPILEYTAAVWGPYQQNGYWILGKSPKKNITVSLKAKVRRNEPWRPPPLTELANSGETSGVLIPSSVLQESYYKV